MEESVVSLMKEYKLTLPEAAAAFNHVFLDVGTIPTVVVGMVVYTVTKPFMTPYIREFMRYLRGVGNDNDDNEWPVFMLEHRVRSDSDLSGRETDSE